MAVLWALCVQKDSQGCQHPTPSVQNPSGCSTQPVPIPQRSLLLSAGFAVSMDAFLHQTCAGSGSGAFSCWQAVLENSFILSTKITWGVADPFPGYHYAVSPSSVSHAGSSLTHGLVGPECVYMGKQNIHGAQCAMCGCKNRAGLQLPAR